MNKIAIDSDSFQRKGRKEIEVMEIALQFT